MLAVRELVPWVASHHAWGLCCSTFSPKPSYPPLTKKGYTRQSRIHGFCWCRCLLISSLVVFVVKFLEYQCWIQEGNALEQALSSSPLFSTKNGNELLWANYLTSLKFGYLICYIQSFVDGYLVQLTFRAHQHMGQIILPRTKNTKIYSPFPKSFPGIREKQIQ